VKDIIEKFSTSPSNTRKIGKVIGAGSCPGDLVLLYGELGSGKTCLTQGILWGMGSDEYARSPTFVMISDHLAIKIKVSGETDRLISLSGIGERYTKIIQTLKEDLKEK
jgi:archaellum biogenesis ATPase FlaH